MTFLTGTVGLVLLFVGGEALVRGAASLALRLGLSPLAVGLTVVAFGTSTPELVVSLDAALAGTPAIAIGNVVGSNIANVTLILGASVLVSPARVLARTVRIDSPVVVALSLALLGALADGSFSRGEGVLFVLGLLGFTAFTLVQGRKETPAVQSEFAEALPEVGRGMSASAGLLLAGLGGLILGGRLFLEAAVVLARTAGMSEAVIGLTVVAVGTSLPELVTSVVAARRGEGDIAVGNVLGSNVFNILGILGITATVTPLDAAGIGWTTLWVMVAAAAVVPLFGLTGWRLSRWEGGVLCGAWAAYTAWLVMAG